MPARICLSFACVSGQSAKGQSSNHVFLSLFVNKMVSASLLFHDKVDSICIIGYYKERSRRLDAPVRFAVFKWVTEGPLGSAEKSCAQKSLLKRPKDKHGFSSLWCLRNRIFPFSELGCQVRTSPGLPDVDLNLPCQIYSGKLCFEIPGN